VDSRGRSSGASTARFKRVSKTVFNRKSSSASIKPGGENLMMNSLTRAVHHMIMKEQAKVGLQDYTKVLKFTKERLRKS